MNFRMGKSVPIKNWRGNRFGGLTDGEVKDVYCTSRVIHHVRKNLPFTKI